MIEVEVVERLYKVTICGSRGRRDDEVIFVKRRQYERDYWFGDDEGMEPETKKQILAALKRMEVAK